MISHEQTASDHLERLLIYMQKTHYPEATDFIITPTLLSRIDQLDNMIAGLPHPENTVSGKTSSK